ncbi:hypothetical protein BSZ35_01300 [Salinibacter sp. 10B]|nr:hypothetical protein BSZ35_01300 [Salinibacter sp. 10B]
MQVAKEEGDVVLHVSDSGTRSDPEAADRLFERFYRTGAAEQCRWRRTRASHREGAYAKLWGNGDGLEFLGYEEGSTFEGAPPQTLS